jgi:tripartite-type tricarboxylate transporter receptor subunit TctC
MAGQARTGKVKALGTSGQHRSAITPETPTVAQAGVPGYEATIWLGLMAPAGTPRPILDRLSSEVNKVVNSPEVKETWGKQGAAPMGMTVDQFDKFLRQDIQKWSKLVKDTGMKVD